jgi:hypothetical protein
MSDRYRCTTGCCVSRPGESLPDFTQRTLVAHGLVPSGVEEFVFTHNDPSFGPCRFCGSHAELRMGMCFDCFKNGTPKEKDEGSVPFLTVDGVKVPLR